ncbi:MAG: autotransporter outer membrane beta-barrel domain-containing protein [Pseudomonadota bacterium]
MSHLRFLAGIFTVCLSALVAVVSLPGKASAQEFDFIQAIIKPQLNIEQSRRIRQIVRDVGGKRWASAMSGGVQDGVVMEPAGYSIVPTADLVTQQAAAGWNIWLDGSAGYIEDTAEFRAYDGSQLSVSLGADTQVNDKLTLGVILNHSATDISNVFVAGSSTTSAVGVGPYMALFLTDTLVFTGSFLYTWTDNTADSGGVSADYASESWGLNGSLTSYHQTGNWMLAPTVGVSFNKERDEAYANSEAPPTEFAASTTRTGTLAFGGSATYTHVLENGMTVQPVVSVEGEWTFLRSVTATSTIAADTQELDVNVTAGSDFQLSNSVSLSLSSTVSGLAKPEYLSVIGGGRLSVSF